MIGSGCCGFLRVHKELKDQGIPIIYKGGKGKYQNGHLTWNPKTGLIWNKGSDSLQRATRYLQELNGQVDVNHYTLPYVPELIQVDSTIQITCLKGDREKTIKALWCQWAYRNPLTMSRTIGRPRYVLDQFPDYSSMDRLEATTRWYDEYYALADQYAVQYPDNFSIQYTGGLATEEEVYTTSLHGGLGNNLFQMAEPIAWCAEHNLPKPMFGTWKLWEGGGLYPLYYNADKLLGGHSGTHEDMKKTFKNLCWQGELTPTFDTKFMINDMFAFSSIHHMRRAILEAFAPSDFIVDYLKSKYDNLLKKETISLQVRTCTLSVDNQPNTLPFSYYVNALKTFQDDTNVLVFMDNLVLESQWFPDLKELFPNMLFTLVNEDQFKSLFLMSMCNHHIIAMSTFGFWGAYLSPNQPNCRTIVHEKFVKGHTQWMIPYKEWEILT